ncbi:MAG: hypothetical protein HC808_16125 [Candidatus Competibacteraceae bacterium]|nr:hypothetical protein [Candidatus Competibacteraceae bacterium]
MAALRTPGSLGTNGNTKPDSGTLAKTSTEPPGVKLQYNWDPAKKEGVTKAIAVKRADAYTGSDGRVVGKVYFAVDIDIMDTEDMLALEPLVNSLAKRVKEGFEISLLCVGAADYRASDLYNYNLGYRRAQNVSRYIKKYVLGSSTVFNPAFLVKTPRSRGESEATQPTKDVRRPSEWTMGKDRVVTILIDKEGLLPPVTLAFEGPGFYTKQLETMELNAGGRIIARKDEQHIQQKERDYQRRYARGKQNLEDDPLRSLVEIRVKYVETTVAGQKRGELHCDAVYVPTGQILFSLQPPALKNANGEFDYKTIHKQLHKEFVNITARINAQLRRTVTSKITSKITE